MTKQEGTDAAVHLAQVATQFAAFYVNIQGAKTQSARKKILRESVESLKKFGKKLEKWNAS